MRKKDWKIGNFCGRIDAGTINKPVSPHRPGKYQGDIQTKRRFRQRRGNDEIEERTKQTGQGCRDPADGRLCGLRVFLPDGSVTEYIKTNLVPLVEDGYYVRGTGDVPVIATEKGVVANVICFDDSNIGFIHGMGSANGRLTDTDVLFVPSWDWQSVKRAHTRMSVFRAVENGAAVVKPTYDGVSIAADPYGRALKKADTGDTGFDAVWFVDVPVAGVRTVYAMGGTAIDLLFLALGPVLMLIGIIVVRRKDKAAG